MDSVAIAARLFLAAVFLVAAAAKLADQPGSREAVAGFGVPGRAVGAAALLLPLVELAVAAALLFTASARTGAVIALALLATFSVAIGAALRRGRTPDCHCFGQIHSSPAGPATLVRNLLLTLPAALVLVHGAGPGIDTWFDARAVAELAAIAASLSALGAGAVALRLRARNRVLRGALAEAEEQLARFPPGLPVGSPAPEFTLASANGETVSLSSLCAGGKPVALVFVAPDCGPCTTLLPQLGRWQQALAGDLTIALVSAGTARDNLAAVGAEGALVLLQEDYEVMRAYRIGGTPATVVVTPDRTIGSAPVGGAVTTESLIRLTARRRPAVAGTSRSFG